MGPFRTKPELNTFVHFTVANAYVLGEYIASLRGYHLNGQLITLPDTYHGFVLKADTPGSLSPEHKFQSLTYWEWDKKPTKNDPFLAALDWLLLSSQVKFKFFKSSL